MARMSDEELIAALRRDDPLAWSVYSATYGDTLFRFIAARTKNLQDAEAIHNEALFKVMDTWRPDRGRLKDWLYTLARQAIVAWARRTAADREVLSLDQLVESGQEPCTVDLAPATQERLDVYRKRLRGFVNTLPPGEQQLFQLCILEDMTDEQVATLTGRKATSIKTMRLRMVRKIKAVLSHS